MMSSKRTAEPSGPARRSGAASIAQASDAHDARMARFSLALATAVGVAIPFGAHAAEVGNIEVCYYCGVGSDAANFSQGVQDGPIFEINDLTSTALTNVTFTADGDTYNVGTVGALSSVILIPGVSNDGGTHAAGAFWQVTGGILDTSDDGPNSNSTQFELNALFGGVSATTGIFTPATSIQALSNDGSVSDISFLGGPGNNDGPCNNCYGPDVVATIDTNSSATPLPATLPLFATGVGALGLFGWRRKRKAATIAA